MGKLNHFITQPQQISISLFERLERAVDAIFGWFGRLYCHERYIPHRYCRHTRNESRLLGLTSALRVKSGTGKQKAAEGGFSIQTR